MKYFSKTEAPRVTVDIVIFTIDPVRSSKEELLGKGGTVETDSRFSHFFKKRTTLTSNGVDDGRLKILLVKRRLEPFKGAWALPGGFIKKGENLSDAAARELKEETGVSSAYLEQLYTFGDPKRDPRGRVITVAYFALMHRKKLKIKASSDASEAKLFSVSSLPRLAFDHRNILAYALTRLRNKIQYTNAVWSILPEYFTLGEIQNVYETIWGRKMDKRNFRKKLLSLGLLMPAGKIKKGFRQRPAKLYQFKTKKYVELKRFF